MPVELVRGDFEQSPSTDSSKRPPRTCNASVRPAADAVACRAHGITTATAQIRMASVRRVRQSKRSRIEATEEVARDNARALSEQTLEPPITRRTGLVASLEGRPPCRPHLFSTRCRCLSWAWHGSLGRDRARPSNLTTLATRHLRLCPMRRCAALSSMTSFP